MGQLTGKVTVITGGSAGIGLATACRFVAEGARVFVTGRRQEPLAAAVAGLGPAATGVAGDVTDPEAIGRLRAAVAEHGQGLDVVFANAGGGGFAPVGEVAPEAYDDVMGSNTRGVFFTVQGLLPLMNENASVILMSSIAATAGMDGLSVYGAAKAATRSFARTFAQELGPERGIRVNSISPGYIRTKPDDAGAEAYQAAGVATIPLRRAGKPEEVAAAALFLASGESSYVTGVDLFVDGGRNQV